MEKTWPVLIFTFTESIPMEAWDLFAGRVTQEAACLGIEEISAPGPAGGFDNPPRQAKLYFPCDLQLPEQKVLRIANECFKSGSFRLGTEQLQDQDWGRNWREYFKMTRVGERLHVAPPWESELPVDSPEGSFAVLIEPGQAFGTGSHETTRLCLAWMEQLALTGRCLLDMGAGSGILCFAAIRLGAASAVGVEYDPVCRENFELNSALNKADGRAHFILGSQPALAVQYAKEHGLPPPDLAVCNMLSERFKPLLPPFARLGIPLLLSGFLLSESEEIEAAIEAVGLEKTDTRQLGEWGAFLCELKDKGESR